MFTITRNKELNFQLALLSLNHKQQQTVVQSYFQWYEFQMPFVHHVSLQETVFVQFSTENDSPVHNFFPATNICLADAI